MKDNVTEILDRLVENHPALECCRESILAAIELICQAFESRGTLFTVGNGGSSADADHISGEMLKGFLRRRPLPEKAAGCLKSIDPVDGELLAAKLQEGLPCIPLGAFSSLLSAARNDLDGQLDYAQVLNALGRPGDVLIAISTSGNSRNVHLAVSVARSKNIKVVGLTGIGGGRLSDEADVIIKAPARETYRIQEYHLPVYHAICAAVEARFFNS